MEEAVEKALAAGFSEIAATDHLDFEYKTLNPYPFIDIKKYTAEVLRLKEKFTGKIRITLGLELGLTPEIAAVSASVVRNFPFEFIICSTHDIKGDGVYGDYFNGRSKAESYGEYFNEILAVIRENPEYDVYGHFDYIERYAPYEDNTVHYKEHKEIIDVILKELISRGKGLEVNTSGYRYGLGHTNPKLEILKRYKELGGEVVTVGSDAHKPGDIGAYFVEAKGTLISAGFKHYNVFRGRKPERVEFGN